MWKIRIRLAQLASGTGRSSVAGARASQCGHLCICVCAVTVWMHRCACLCVSARVCVRTPCGVVCMRVFSGARARISLGSGSDFLSPTPPQPSFSLPPAAQSRAAAMEEVPRSVERKRPTTATASRKPQAAANAIGRSTVLPSTVESGDSNGSSSLSRWRGKMFGQHVTAATANRGN